MSEPAARDIINNLTTPDAAVSNFVDPYEFEDQLILISMKHDGMNLQEETLIYTVWCSIVNLMMWWVDGQSTPLYKITEYVYESPGYRHRPRSTGENYSDEKVEAGDNQEPRRANNSKLEKIDEASEDEYGFVR